MLLFLILLCFASAMLCSITVCNNSIKLIVYEDAGTINYTVIILMLIYYLPECFFSFALSY
jgi:hypothetical protein